MLPDVSTQKVTSRSKTSPKMVGRLLMTGMVVAEGVGDNGGADGVKAVCRVDACITSPSSSADMLHR